MKETQALLLNEYEEILSEKAFYEKELWKSMLEGGKKEWTDMMQSFLYKFLEISRFPRIDIKISGIQSDPFYEFLLKLKEMDCPETREAERFEKLYHLRAKESFPIKKIFEMNPGKTDDKEAFIVLYKWAMIHFRAYSYLQNGYFEEGDGVAAMAVPSILRISVLITGKMHEFIGYWKAEMKKRRISQKNPKGRKEKNLDRVSAALDLYDGKDDKIIIPKIMTETGLGERTVRDHIKAIREKK